MDSPRSRIPHATSASARPRRRGAARSAAAPALLLLALASCAPRGGAGHGFAMPPMPVEVSPVHPQIVRDQFRALGDVQSEATIQVVAEIGARVMDLPFEEGRAVSQGQLLARLDDRELAAESRRAAAQRAQAASDYERAKTLAGQNLTSQKDLDDARAAFEIADANAALAQAHLDKTRIRAPFAGLVGRKRVSVGAYVRDGDVLTDLTRIDEMKVSFAAPERYAATLKPGVPVEITTPAYPELGFEGRLSAIDPVIDPQTRTLQVTARIPNRGGRLRPGMSANVAVTFSQRAKALVVPDEAVFAEGSQNFVYVVKADSTVEKTAVTLGTRDSMHVEVVRGLSPGVTVVRAGHQKLFPGAHVMPIPEQGMAGGPGGPTAARAADPASSRPAGAAGSPAGKKAGGR